MDDVRTVFYFSAFLVTIEAIGGWYDGARPSWR